MSDEFDYGGDVASNGGFKQPPVGARKARLYGLLRLGTFSETFHNGKVAEVKAPAPQAIAIFHLMGKADLAEDEPVLFTKSFPLKKGEKSFLHGDFIPAMGGMSKHKGFSTMTGAMHTITLKASKTLNDDGTPKYVNFGSVSAIDEDTLEMLEAQPQLAALESSVGFLKEGELTEEALLLLHPTREFAGILMQTEEYKAGTHPSQELITSMYEKNKDRYTIKAKDATDEQASAGNQAESKPTTPPEELDEEEEF